MAKINGFGNSNLYILTNNYPKSEVFGLTSQTRRAAVSIPLNISEGAAKSSNKDFLRFLEMAVGSSNELETALIVAKNIEYISSETLDKYLDSVIEVRKMICKFMDNLKGK